MSVINKPSRRPLPVWLKKLIAAIRFLVLRTGTLGVFHLFTLLSVRYMPNRSSVYVSELLLPMLLVAPLTLLTFHLYYKIFRDSLTAHIANFSMLYVFVHFEYNYNSTSSLATSLSPFRLGTTFRIALGVIAVKFVVSGAIALSAKFIFDRLSINKIFPVLKLLTFVIFFISVNQAYKILDYNLRTSDQTSFKYVLPDYRQDMSKIVLKPDIYYFVFDRYASNSWLQTEYGFDNSDLTNFLVSEGFTVKDQALSNYPFTGASVSSTLALEYHDAATGEFKNSITTFPVRSILNNPPVVQLLRKDGYQYYQIGSWWGPTADKIHADYNLTSKAKLNLLGYKSNLTEFQELFVDASVPSYIYKPFIKNMKIDERSRPTDQISSLENVTSEHSDKPKFVFTHVLLPHPPYLFDENGNPPTYDTNGNDEVVDEKVKYINQLKFTNTLIKQAISAIREKSPGAIIVLQADEGPYPAEMRGKNFNQLETIESLSDHGLRSKYTIQAAYYFPDKSSAAKINSSVDAFRVTLSDYLGYNIPSLPSCQYSGRTLVNERLGVPLSPECPVLDK